MKFLLLIFASVVLFFPAYWLFEPVVGQNWGAGIAAVAMYLAFPLIGLRWIDYKTKKPDSLLEALRSGTLVLADYNVRDAVVLYYFTTGSSYYLLAIADKKTLVLSAEYCDELVEKGLFPSSRIRLYWDKNTLKTYGIEAIGNKVLISKSLELEETPSNLVAIENQLKDRDIFNQSLSDFVSSIKVDT